jgi:hypothetical protein
MKGGRNGVGKIVSWNSKNASPRQKKKKKKKGGRKCEEELKKKARGAVIMTYISVDPTSFHLSFRQIRGY